MRRSLQRWVFAVACVALGVPVVGCDDSGTGDTDTALAGHRNRGKAHFENGETAEAIAEFETCLRLSANDPMDRLSLAKAHFLAENYDLAIETFEELESELPEVADIPYNLGIIFKRLGATEKSVVQLERLVGLDDRCVEGWFNLATMYQRVGRQDDALRCVEKVLSLDPHHAAAHYQRATLARMTGNAELARESLARFTELKDRIPAERLSSTGLEESEYFEIDVRRPEDPTDVVADATPEPITVRLTDHTQDAGLADALPVTDAVFADLDNDGDPDLVTVGEAGIHTFINDSRGHFTEHAFPGLDPSDEGGPAFARLEVADPDNDADIDLYLVRAGSNRLYRAESGEGGEMTFSDETETSRTADPGATGGALFVDYDHDGDLDLFALHREDATSVLYRNNGVPEDSSPLTFTEITADANLPPMALRRAISRNFDRDRDLDLVVLTAEGTLRVFANAGQQQFEEVDAFADPIAGGGDLDAGDLNGDGWEDLVVTSENGIAVYRNRGGCRFVPHEPLPSSVALGRWAAVHLTDSDLDGDLDLILAGSDPGDGLRWLENDGGGRFSDGTDRVGLGTVRVSAPSSGAVSLRSVDVDGDGDPDVLLVSPGHPPMLVRNEGDSSNRPVVITFEGGKSNRLGIGAAIEIQAGPFYVARTVADPAPMVLGVGTRQRLDYVRVAWPSGIVQNEIDIDLDSRPVVEVTEKEEAMGSCPSLFAWDGERFVFITDVLASASVGLSLDGNEPMAFDDEELIRIPPGLLAEIDGEYRFNLTEELNELVYLDRVELVAVDHPADVEVYSNTILREPPFPDADIVVVRDQRPPVAAVDQDGVDRLADISRSDARYAAAFTPLDDQFLGMCDLHRLTLDLGEDVDPATVALVIDAWMDWPETATFLSVSQNESLDLILPMIEAEGADGWRTVHAGFGIQALKPKDVVVDLRQRLRAGEHRIRLSTNLVTYWNRIGVADVVDDHSALRRWTAAPTRADLHFRGHSELHAPHGGPLRVYDYDRLNLKPRWVGSTGGFTRYGDVLPLVTDWDDRFAIFNTGDEVSFAFTAGDLPPPAHPGIQRDFFLRIAGFEKQADYGTLASGTVDPLPFRAMTSYPYGEDERYPETALYREYLETYNTRVIADGSEP